MYDSRNLRLPVKEVGTRAKNWFVSFLFSDTMMRSKFAIIHPHTSLAACEVGLMSLISDHSETKKRLQLHYHRSKNLNHSGDHRTDSTEHGMDNSMRTRMIFSFERIDSLPLPIYSQHYMSISTRRVDQHFHLNLTSIPTAKDAYVGIAWIAAMASLSLKEFPEKIWARLHTYHYGDIQAKEQKKTHKNWLPHLWPLWTKKS